MSKLGPTVLKKFEFSRIFVKIRSYSTIKISRKFPGIFGSHFFREIPENSRSGIPGNQPYHRVLFLENCLKIVENVVYVNEIEMELENAGFVKIQGFSKRRDFQNAGIPKTQGFSKRRDSQNPGIMKTQG